MFQEGISLEAGLTRECRAMSVEVRRPKDFLVAFSLEINILPVDSVRLYTSRCSRNYEKVPIFFTRP
jgi:hypothetical protein